MKEHIAFTQRQDMNLRSLGFFEDDRDRPAVCPAQQIGDKAIGNVPFFVETGTSPPR